MASPAVFRLMCDVDAFASFRFKTYKNSLLSKLLGLEPFHQTWESIPFEVDDKNGRLPIGDVSAIDNVSTCIVLSEGAMRLLQPLIAPFTEAVSLGSQSGLNYFLIHVLAEIDALDAEKSKFMVVDGELATGSILKYVFRESLLTGKHIFHIPQLRGRNPLVSQEFKACIEKNGLSGCKFRKLN